MADLRGLHLHFDAPSGAAGDMTLGALFDLGVPVEAVKEVLSRLDVGAYKLSVAKGMRGGIAGTDVRVKVAVGEHEHEHEHGDDGHDHHSHAHELGHPHRHYGELRALVEAGTSGRVKELALAIFDKVAVAEAKLHGVAVDEVAFHEVGAIDSIVDVVGSAAALVWLAPSGVSAGPLALGGGTVRAAHGRLPVPAPATLEICRAAGVPTYSGNVERELLTPTGAAILATIVETWGPMPAMTAVAVGYGAGDMELADRPNLLRAIAGRPAAAQAEPKEIVELAANLDDMSPELCEHVAERLFEAGALDVWWTPAVMKKSRPAFVLGVLVPAARAAEATAVMLSETTTLGVRSHPVARQVLGRRSEAVLTEYGEVIVKLGLDEGARVVNVAPEHDSCRAVARARGVALKDVYAAAVAAYRVKKTDAVIRSQLVAARILVAGGDAAEREALSASVRSAGYEPIQEGPTPDVAVVIDAAPVAGVRSVVVLGPGGDFAARMEQALAAGADAVLAAPVTEPSLRRELERQLAAAAARSGVASARRCAEALLEIEKLLSVGESIRTGLNVAAAAVGADTAVCVFESEAPWLLDEISDADPPVAFEDHPDGRAAVARGAVVLVGDAAAAGVDTPPVPSSGGPRAGAVVFPVEWRGKPRGALIFRRSRGSIHPKRLELDEHEVSFARILAGILAAVNEATAGTVQADVLDRTDRIQLPKRDGKGERRLRAVEKFRSYFDAAADSIIALDGDARVLFVNRAAEALTGFSRATLVGKSLTDLVPAEASLLLEPVLRGVVGGTNLEPFDLPIHTTSGDRLWVSVSTSTVLAEHGVACLSFRDVTSERHLEAELRKTKEFLEKLIDSTVDAIIAADIEGKVILYNPGAERVFGWPAEEVIGRMSVERLYPEGVARQIMRMLRSPSYGGMGRLELTRREILTRSGDVVPVNMTASVIYEDGREVASVGILSDLRDRIRIEQRLLMAQEKLLVTEKQAVVAELAGTAAHELNQPLTSVTLYVEMMLRRMPADDVNQRAVQAIAREVARMAEIVKKIGRITRYETKQYVGGAAILNLEKSSPEESAAVLEAEGTPREVRNPGSSDNNRT